jgi:hypothetical protein
MKTGIEIKTDFFPLAFILFFCTPVIEINEKKHTKSWGKHFFDLEQGEYKVKIYFPYLGMAECGANQIIVNIETGQISKVNYYMPPWMLGAGSIKEV